MGFEAFPLLPISLTVGFAFWLPGVACFSCGNHTWLEDRACLPWDYNRLKKPDDKVDVRVWFKVTDIMKIDSQGGTCGELKMQRCTQNEQMLA